MEFELEGKIENGEDGQMIVSLSEGVQILIVIMISCCGICNCLYCICKCMKLKICPMKVIATYAQC